MTPAFNCYPFAHNSYLFRIFIFSLTNRSGALLTQLRNWLSKALVSKQLKRLLQKLRHVYCCKHPHHLSGGPLSRAYEMRSLQDSYKLFDSSYKRLDSFCKRIDKFARFLQKNRKTCKNLASKLVPVCIHLQDCFQVACKFFKSAITRVGYTNVGINFVFLCKNVVFLSPSSHFLLLLQFA